QLESFSFPVAYPTDAVRIREQLEELKERCGDFLPEAAKELVSFLRDEGVDARIEGRQKQDYSIFRKMGEKSITHIDDLYDLFALRVIVPSDTACYQVLGLLHRIGHPVPNRFKDYIAFPKPNGYQSLHTTLAHLPGVPDGIFIEVQIRTEAMHRESEYGIAAHWSYKEGGHALLAARRAQLQKALSLQPTAERRSATTPADHIFVLTPKGDVIELPERSTPLDFAFQVHSNLGLAFKAARVNGMIVPMRYELENGDVVDILRHSDPKPSPQWLTLLRTAPARTRLRRFLAERDRPRFIDLGRASLNRELKSHGLPPLDPDLSILKVFDGKKLSLAEREDILMMLGQGSMKTSGVFTHIDAVRHTASSPLQKKKQQIVRPGSLPLRLESDIRMPVRFAQCCKPDEGKRAPLIGVVNRGGEVRVHRSDCRMTKNVNPERRMRVRWI
ncbi:bifunctional (p)ppGpp synthetase/guanosine-3',5'-bis(diphosphate) 3'-pyrophosphohydrolase, partial [Candidatus Peregrinibacteria bacterium]|nr:bifunctional (p)ppGpp synthetase/guanosine-3',5'-bis(diphosphate) 3'-pyrophosphohydrolase [Candidatus Peregrinibacteria bacterium]